MACGPVDNATLKLLLERATHAESRGHFDIAIQCYREAMLRSPRSAEAAVNLAALLGSLGRFEEALPVCQHAVDVEPRSLGAQLNLASTLAELRRLDEAIVRFEAASTLFPSDQGLQLDLAACLLLAGRVPEAIRILRRSLDHNPRAIDARSALLFALNFSCESAAQLRAEHEQFGAALGSQRVSRASATGNVRKTPIEVGFVSGDLHRHSVAYFLAPLLDGYDRDRFRVTCYSTGRITDAVSAWLRARAEVWVESHGVSDEVLDQRVRRDAIDILVDLGGHTSSGRPALFAMGPAPVQVTFLGYPTTTGIPAMGYRVSDPLVDPAHAPSAGTERVLRMPHSYFCYRPPADAPEVAPPPLSLTGRVTFGSFNALSKITDKTLSLWSAVLAAIPAAQLLIKGQGLSVAAARSRLLARCAAAGIHVGRVELMEWQRDVASHLHCYSRVDVALDTFPYNGATTTCEALWMGVPVVSLSGETHAARMGLSILNAAGAGEWAVRDEASFIAICMTLAKDPARLASRRASLRAGVAASALMDERSYVRAFEDLLVQSLGHG